MSELIKVQVMVGDKILGFCEFGPMTSKSVLVDIENGEIKTACKSICGVAHRKDEDWFQFSKEIKEGLE